MSKTVPQSEWKWFGMAGHFICGQWCRFHLCTQIGDYLVSTVGAYVHPRHGMGQERLEAEWYRENFPGEDIGLNRKFETMVFRCGEMCGCGCGQPELLDGQEIDSKGYNTISDANNGHFEMCRKWAAIPVAVDAN